MYLDTLFLQINLLNASFLNYFSTHIDHAHLAIFLIQETSIIDNNEVFHVCLLRRTVGSLDL